MSNPNVQFQSCMICVHLAFCPGAGPWSEVTPGDDASARCKRGHWREEGFKDWPSLGRQHGKSCQDFETPA